MPHKFIFDQFIKIYPQNIFNASFQPQTNQF